LSSSGSGSDDFNFYGQATVAGETYSAFSMANTSCNIGDQVAQWIDTPNNARNPLIAPNIYRIHNGRMQHIGMGWPKHSFCAVSEPTCGSCQSTGCDTLGIGCADTYWAGLNGDQFGIGPRWEVNPQGEGANRVHDEVFLAPDGPNVAGGSALGGRVLIKHSDLLPGALYVAEIHLLTHDEPLANRYNNSSYRFVNVATNSISGDAFNGFPASTQNSLRHGLAPIMAWKEVDPAVTIVEITENEDGNGNGGRFYVGYLVTDNGDGTWHYEYAVMNYNSDRGARAFRIPVPECVELTNVDFQDIHYHSGDRVNKTTGASDWDDNIDGTDWASAFAGGVQEWSTVTFAQDINGNALRWGSMYNFAFDADAAPSFVNAELGLYKGGSGADDIVGTVQAPSTKCVAVVCPADCAPDNGDGTFGNLIVNIDDLLRVINDFGAAGGPCDNAPDNGDGTFGNNLVNIDDLLNTINSFGPCPA
jgi:hypothetical protein